MIRLSETKVDEHYNIDDNGIITDLQGNIQKTYLHQGRYEFKKIATYKILMWTRYGWRDGRIWDIHHLDGNPLNNNINNLKFIQHSLHSSITNKGRIFTKQHKENISKSGKGRHWKLTEKTKRKMSDTRKGKNNPMYGKHWKKDPITGKRIYY